MRRHCVSDGVDGITRGWQFPSSTTREPGIESGNVPFSPFPMRTKMRLKLLAAGKPTATSPDGADPARPGRSRRTPSLPGRSVSSPKPSETPCGCDENSFTPIKRIFNMIFQQVPPRDRTKTSQGQTVPNQTGSSLQPIHHNSSHFHHIVGRPSQLQPGPSLQPIHHNSSQFITFSGRHPGSRAAKFKTKPIPESENRTISCKIYTPKL